MDNQQFLESKVGLHRHMNDSDFDSEQLKIGIEVEMEHTNDPLVAKEIAKDHLAECKNYYTRLFIMEKECEEEGYGVEENKKIDLNTYLNKIQL